MPYTKNGIKYPRCTNIISDCTDSSGALTQWAANMVVEYMKEHLSDDPFCPYKGSEIFEKLEKARFNFRKVSQKALDIGSEVHDQIEKYLKACMVGKSLGETLSLVDAMENLSEESKNAFGAFLKWKDENNLKPISLEQTVWGERWAGTCDYLGYYKDKLYVIDWKTSKAFYPEMRYQVAAYRSVTRYPTGEHYHSHGIKGHAKHYYPEGCGILRLDKETGMPEFKDTSKTYEKDLRVFNCMVELYFARHPRIAKRFDGVIPF